MSTVKQKALKRHIGSYGEVQAGDTFEAPGEEAKHNVVNHLAKDMGGAASKSEPEDATPTRTAAEAPAGGASAGKARKS